MSATTWLIIAIIGFSLAGIALVVAIFMFINQNIPSVIGDLTGKTVAREIKAMREFNKAHGDRRFRPSEVNLERGTLTEKVEVSREDQQAMAEAHLSKRLDKTPSEDIPVKKKTKGGTIGLNDFESPATDVLNEGSNPTEVLSDNATEVLSSNETEVLSDTTNATEVLSSNETEVLSNNATEVLSDSTTVLSEGTTVLSENVEVSENLATPISFKVTKDKTITHSDEVIE